MPAYRLDACTAVEMLAADLERANLRKVDILEGTLREVARRGADKRIPKLKTELRYAQLYAEALEGQLARAAEKAAKAKAMKEARAVKEAKAMAEEEAKAKAEVLAEEATAAGEARATEAAEAAVGSGVAARAAGAFANSNTQGDGEGGRGGGVLFPSDGTQPRQCSDEAAAEPAAAELAAADDAIESTADQTCLDQAILESTRSWQLGAQLRYRQAVRSHSERCRGPPLTDSLSPRADRLAASPRAGRYASVSYTASPREYSLHSANHKLALAGNELLKLRSSGVRRQARIDRAMRVGIQNANERVPELEATLECALSNVEALKRQLPKSSAVRLIGEAEEQARAALAAEAKAGAARIKARWRKATLVKVALV